MAIFTAVSVVMIVFGILLFGWGNRVRYSLPLERREYIGVSRMTVGIIAATLPMFLGWSWWVLENTVGKLGTV